MSFASAVWVITLFVALGGTTYAAVTVPKNSVKAKQIAANAVGASEITANAVRTGEVRNGSLLAADIGAGQAPPGAKGDKGDSGDTGAFTGGTVQFTQASTDLADGATASYNAFCPTGLQAIGGGFSGDLTQFNATNVGSSRPSKSAADTEPPLDGQSFKGWRITVQNLAGGVTTGIRPQVWVVCAPPADVMPRTCQSAPAMGVSM